MRLLSHEEETFTCQLYNTLSTIIDEDPDKFDEYDETSDVIELKDFVSFILTPFTASLLIAEDRDISLEDATDVQEESNNFGDMMQPDDDDPEIHELHRLNIRAMKNSSNPFFSQPPRYRKPTFAVRVYMRSTLVQLFHVLFFQNSLQTESEALQDEDEQLVGPLSLLRSHPLINIQKPNQVQRKPKADPKAKISLDDFIEVS